MIDPGADVPWWMAGGLFAAWAVRELWGALKLRRTVSNAERVLAIELMAAAEGLEYRRPLRAGSGGCTTTTAALMPRSEIGAKSRSGR